jgi:hypothetical protein
MEELLATVGVVALFLLRVGVPVLVLVGIGILIDRWQSSREKEIDRLYQRRPDELSQGEGEEKPPERWYRGREQADKDERVA